MPAGALCSIITNPSLLYAGPDLVLSIIYVSGGLAVSYAMLYKWSFLLWGIWFVFPFVINLASLSYQVQIDAHLLSEIIGASPQDVANFLTLKNVLLFIGCIILTFGFSLCILFIMKQCARKKLLPVGSALLLIAFTVSSVTGRNLWAYNGHRTPESHLLAVKQAYILAQELQSNLVQTAREISSSAIPAPVLKEESESRECIFLLHIGESVRSDHLSLFGYGKTTTPNLEEMPRLIAYRDCISVAPSTVPSTFAILTNAKTDIRQTDIDNSLKPTCGGLMDIFHALDFSCFAFVINQDHNEGWGALYENLLKNTFASCADEMLSIPDVSDSHSQIKQIAETINKEENKHVFCFINNLGSHLPFVDYNKTEPPFQPADSRAYSMHPEKNPEAAAVLSNTYDCTIHHTDDYIAKLLKCFQGKSFIYIYISDHGEYLGDNGIFVRNGDKEVFFNTPVCQVPFLIITSPEFEQQNPHYAEALQKLQKHSDMSIGQEHIFHTVLGILGIQTPYYEEELDLTSDKVLPYTGPHPSRGGSAIDGKKWY